ncbi:hypothetical protein EV421DRAFT_1738308 [Armillaria borealis]|uniref:Uncharacterized protein n=1 Tax=Armillaria borealis TaxID=47425 RepID=A0AA39J9V6_9AGAR|nr:hypothetical protein EV421DRAFT_1738308 [Armillaria borealis]
MAERLYHRAYRVVYRLNDKVLNGLGTPVDQNSRNTNAVKMVHVLSSPNLYGLLACIKNENKMATDSQPHCNGDMDSPIGPLNTPIPLTTVPRLERLAARLRVRYAYCQSSVHHPGSMKTASMGDVSNGNFLRVEFLIAGSGDGGSREMVLELVIGAHHFSRIRRKIPDDPRTTCKTPRRQTCDAADSDSEFHCAPPIISGCEMLAEVHVGSES